MRLPSALAHLSVAVVLGLPTPAPAGDPGQSNNAPVESRHALVQREAELFSPIPTAPTRTEPAEPEPSTDEALFEPFGNEVLSGADPESTDLAARDQRLWISGYLQHQIAYATGNKSDEFAFSRRRPGIRKSRTTASIDIDSSLSTRILFRFSATGFYDWSYLRFADDVDDDEVDELESEFELRDTYLNVELVDDLWLKVGRQTIAWGEAEYTQVLDLANPRDEREFGFVDLEDARIPTLASRISYVGERWGIDLVLNGEFRPSKLPPRGSDFDPFIRVPADIDFDADEPNVSFTDPEFLGRIFLSFPSGDLSLIYANVYDDLPVIEQHPNDPGSLTLDYPRLSALGLGANFISGPWLLKTEIGYKDGLRFPLDPSAAETVANVEKPLYQIMLGVEYAGIPDFTPGLEARINHIDDYEVRLAPSRNESLVVASMGYTFWREKADIGLVWAHWFQQNSDSVRITFSYDITDAIELSAGYIDYISRDKDASLQPYRDSDRLVLGVRYSF